MDTFFQHQKMKKFILPSFIHLDMQNIPFVFLSLSFSFFLSSLLRCSFFHGFDWFSFQFVSNFCRKAFLSPWLCSLTSFLNLLVPFLALNGAYGHLLLFPLAM